MGARIAVVGIALLAGCGGRAVPPVPDPVPVPREAAARPPAEVSPPSPREQLARARAAFDAGEHGEAEDRLLALVCEERTDIDPRAGCRARRAGEVARMAWLHLGELWFEGRERVDLERAAWAYGRVIAMSPPGHRLRSAARYKLAWCHYRLDAYGDAIRSFAALLDEDPGSELRPEAVLYIAICIAEDDRDADGVADDRQLLDRPAVAALVARAPPWLADVGLALGDILRDEARYAEAVTAYTWVLTHWPDHPRASQARAGMRTARSRMP